MKKWILSSTAPGVGIRMTRTNGGPEVEPEGMRPERELPAMEDTSQKNAAPQTATKSESSPENESRETMDANELFDRLARLQAEFDNSRKRAVKEQEEFKDFALTNALQSLLPVLDSFDRALQTSPKSLEDFRSGVELIRKQLQDALIKLGVRPVPAAGEPFDPHLHEAVEAVDTVTAEDNQVLEELQRGYKLKDRLLRPAMVRVARNASR
jgi:molecular chaperone GrpE